MKNLYVFVILLFLTVSVQAQFQLNLPSGIPNDNLGNSYSLPGDLTLGEIPVESNLKLNLPAELSSSHPSFNEFIKMLVMIHFIYGITTGDFSESWSGLIGGTATFGYLILPYLMLTGTIGYLNYLYKEDLPEGYDLSYYAIPILVGLRYYFSPAASKLMFYALLQLGLHLFSYSATYEAFGQQYDQSESETKFGIHPGLGLMIALSATMLLDFNIQYMLIPHDPSSLNSIAFLLGIAFALGGGGGQM